MLFRIANREDPDQVASSELMLNKRALGPWVAHLRMTVYKGIGKHRSSQSPATNLIDQQFH